MQLFVSLTRPPIMSSKRSIPNTIRDCATPPKRKKQKNNPKEENLQKTPGNTTTSSHENITHKKEWSVQKNLEEFKNFFSCVFFSGFSDSSFEEKSRLFKELQEIIRKISYLEEMLIPDLVLSHQGILVI